MNKQRKNTYTHLVNDVNSNKGCEGVEFDGFGERFAAILDKTDEGMPETNETQERDGQQHILVQISQIGNLGKTLVHHELERHRREEQRETAGLLLFALLLLFSLLLLLLLLLLLSLLLLLLLMSILMVDVDKMVVFIVVDVVVVVHAI